MESLKKINEKILDELEFGFSCEKIIHQGWKEQQQQLKEKFKKMKEETGFVPSELFGKWQYVYRSEKGQISLIRINITMFEKDKRKWVWEMWSEEKLFSDVRRYKTKKEAEKIIREYLC